MAKKNNKSKAKAKAAPVRARDATDPRSNARFNFVSDELFDFSAAPRECAEARDGGAFGRQPVDGRLETADAAMRRRVLRARARSVRRRGKTAAARVVGRARVGSAELLSTQRLLRRGSLFG